MHIRTRRVIFYSLVLIFVVFGVGITLYAKGVRIDSDTFSITNVGGMYILPSPSDATMMLDGKEIKRNSGIFQKGTLVTGLFPKDHVLELSAQGYKSWKRTISVLPSRVAEIQYAVLVPEQPIITLGTTVQNFWLIGDAPLLQSGTSTFTFRDQIIPTKTAPLSWNENEFLTRTGTSSYAIVSISNTTSTSLRPLLSNLGAEAAASSTSIHLDENNTERFFVFATHSLTLGDLSNNTITSLVRSTSSTIAAFAATRNRIAWAAFDNASGTTRIAIYDRFSRQTEFLPETLSGRTRSITWGDGDMLGVLQANGDAYLYNLDASKKSLKRSNNVRDIYFTSDGSKAALIGTSLEIMSFTNDDYARFNLKDMRSIQTVMWHRNSHNLFLQYPNHVMFLDIEDAYQENIVQVATTTMSSYDEISNRFYYLENGAAEVLQFPKD